MHLPLLSIHRSSLPCVFIECQILFFFLSWPVTMTRLHCYVDPSTSFKSREQWDFTIHWPKENTVRELTVYLRISLSLSTQTKVFVLFVGVLLMRVWVVHFSLLSFLIPLDLSSRTHLWQYSSVCWLTHWTFKEINSRLKEMKIVVVLDTRESVDQVFLVIPVDISVGMAVSSTPI